MKVDKYFKENEPVVRNRACVINTSIEITFISKDQLDLFIAEFMCLMEYPSFEIQSVPGDSLELTEYVVSIRGLPWANNLVSIARLLDKFDYNCCADETDDQKEETCCS